MGYFPALFKSRYCIRFSKTTELEIQRQSKSQESQSPDFWHDRFNLFTWEAEDGRSIAAMQWQYRWSVFEAVFALYTVSGAGTACFCTEWKQYVCLLRAESCLLSSFDVVQGRLDENHLFSLILTKKNCVSLGKRTQIDWDNSISHQFHSPASVWS